MGLSRGRGVQLGRFAALLAFALVCAAAGHQPVRNRDGTTYCPPCRRLWTANETRRTGSVSDIYIVFDRPPAGDRPSTFIEVEDEDGNGLSPEQTGATWRRVNEHHWALGPFARAEAAP